MKLTMVPLQNIIELKPEITVIDVGGGSGNAVRKYDCAKA
jgi:hypothetical protein